MAIDVKICGLSNHPAVEAAVGGGARYIGFIFYPPSPRAVTAEQAIDLGQAVPRDRIKVGVMVDPDDLPDRAGAAGARCDPASWEGNAGTGQGGQGS